MSAAVCQNPNGERHEIGEGERRITLSAGINWGANDLREPWQGDYAFCSFRCLSEWAATRAQDHDGITLKEGTP